MPAVGYHAVKTLENRLSDRKKPVQVDFSK